MAQNSLQTLPVLSILAVAGGAAAGAMLRYGVSL
jgi:hypothetical protein